MRVARYLAAAAAALLVALPAAAQDMDKIKAELKKVVADAPIESIKKTPYAGLYEVVVGGEVVYTDEKGSFLFLGNIIDINNKENLTEARMRQVNKIDFAALPFDRAIKIVRGNGSRKIALFEDPNCGYCKRFERDLQGVSDITVYVFLYPILSADSVEKSKAIWCSKEPGKLWMDTMTKEVVPSGDKSCPTPLDQNVAYGRDKKITGTPTIIFEDGERVPGAMKLADFEKKLAAAKSPNAKVSQR
jgi:thiol:disulfide interchange protein DsbC